MVLAGGVGERLYPLTKERAKPAVYFGGPYRIIDFTLSNCINSGLRRIFIALQYKSLSLSRHIRMGWSVVADELGEFVEILSPQKRVGEHWYLGTADAVYQNLYSILREKPALPDRAVGRSRLQDGLRANAARPQGTRCRARRIGGHRDPVGGGAPLRRAADRRTGSHHRLPRKAEEPAARRAGPGVDGHLHLRHGQPGAGARGGRGAGRPATISARTSSRRSSTRFRSSPTGSTTRTRRRPSTGATSARSKRTSTRTWICAASIRSSISTIRSGRCAPTRCRRRRRSSCSPTKAVRCGQALDSIISAGCIVSGSRICGSVLCPNVRVHSFCEIEQSILMPGVRVGRHARDPARHHRPRGVHPAGRDDRLQRRTKTAGATPSPRAASSLSRPTTNRSSARSARRRFANEAEFDRRGVRKVDREDSASARTRDSGFPRQSDGGSRGHARQAA